MSDRWAVPDDLLEKFPDHLLIDIFAREADLQVIRVADAMDYSRVTIFRVRACHTKFGKANREKLLRLIRENREAIERGEERLGALVNESKRRSKRK